MMDLDFEKCSLWPIRIHVPNGDGYTLWGSGGGEMDLLLAVADRLRAFTRWPSLVEFVHQGTECNLSELSGYRLLRSQMEQPGNRVPASVRQYPLREVATWLRVEPARWTTEMRSTAVDCLNLLWDAARTLGDEGTQAQLRREVAPLGRLMDALTFADDASSTVPLAEALASGAADEYSRTLTLITGRWDVVS